MADDIYRVIEVVGTSSEGVSDAIRKGVGRANETLQNLDWFEVVQTRGHIENGEIKHYQVHLKVGFRLDS
jgi:flavin-binding protein dodecin